VRKTSLLACLVCLALPLAADTLDQALALDQKSIRASAAVQKQIDGLDDSRQEMLEEYLRIERRSESLRTDNQQLQTRIEIQQRHLESLNEQRGEAETTRLGVIPLMEQMQQVLGNFIAADLPFLPEERQSRLARLADRLAQPGVSDGERFQQLLEAYQVELEYGRTIEAYQAVLEGATEAAPEDRTVVFFRLGRTGLFYLSLDGVEGAAWNQATKNWDILGREYRQELAKALRIARQESVPELLRLPLPAPVDVGTLAP